MGRKTSSLRDLFRRKEINHTRFIAKRDVQF